MHSGEKGAEFKKRNISAAVWDPSEELINLNTEVLSCSCSGA